MVEPSPMPHHSNVIGGRRVASSAGADYVIRNPARPGERLAEFADSTSADVTAAVDAADRAAAAWAATPGPQRGAILFRFADLLEEARTELARIITLEQGKALAEAVRRGRPRRGRGAVHGRRSQPPGRATRFQASGRDRRVQTVAEPLGVIAAICPWNFPVVTPVRKIAPALAFGNTVVFKPAVADAVVRGLPDGAVGTAGRAAGRGQSGHGLGCRGRARRWSTTARVRGITLHGIDQGGHARSTKRPPAGWPACSSSWAARIRPWSSIATTSTRAAREIVAAAFLCSGQRCTAISRVIVLDTQADALVERILTDVGRIKVGDGLEAGTTMGPLVSRAQLAHGRRATCGRGVESGCRCSPAARRSTDNPEEDGYFYAPTVFDRVPADSPLAPRRDLRSGAADPPRGATWTRRSRSPTARATGWRRRCSRHGSPTSISSAGACEAGMIHINHGTASQAHVPFGGVKESGQGAYSIGPTAREFFTNVKAVYVKW